MDIPHFPFFLKSEALRGFDSPVQHAGWALGIGRVAQVNFSAERALPKTDFMRCVRNWGAKFGHPVKHTDANIGFCFLVVEGARFEL